MAAQQSIFGRLAKASSTEGRLPFISKGGVTLDEVLRIRAGETREEDPYFAVDLRCSGVISELPLSAKVQAYNTKMSDANMSSKMLAEGCHQPDDQYTSYVKIAKPNLDVKLGNVKNMAEAVLEALGFPADDIGTPGSEGYEQGYNNWDEAAWHEAILDKEQGLASGDGTLAKGIMLVRSSESRVNKNGDGGYIVSTFTSHDEQPALNAEGS